MNSAISHRMITLGLCALTIASTAYSQDEGQLPDWTADQELVGLLDEPCVDSRITIRPPVDFRRVDRPNPPELSDRGAYNYGWIPGEGWPRGTNLSVGLTPFAKPSSSALDKTVEGMKQSIQENLKDVQFGDVKKGTFRGKEARMGKFTAEISGKKLAAFYLIGIDERGSFACTAMLPLSEATSEKSRVLKASLLTFDRAE